MNQSTLFRNQLVLITSATALFIKAMTSEFIKIEISFRAPLWYTTLLLSLPLIKRLTCYPIPDSSLGKPQ